MENTRFVNKAIVKKDAQALLSGRPVYTDDIAPADCLVVKLLRSPHAHAWIEDISVDAALKVPGIEAVFTYKVDNPYAPTHERGLRFDDPTVGVDWKITEPAILNLSDKDRNAALLQDAEINFEF